MTSSAASSRRIAIANPFCWPEVRRGSERLLNELSGYLARRGNAVSMVVSALDPARVVTPDGVAARVVPQHRGPNWPGFFDAKIGFGFRAASVLGDGFDSIHCLSHFDGFAAARAAGRPRFVLHCVGIPARAYFRRLPAEWLMFHRAMRAAREVLVISEAAREALRRDWGREGVILPPPASIDLFTAQPKPPPANDILFSGSADEERKGAALLARAFGVLRRDVPAATLTFSGAASDATRQRILAAADPDAHAAIRFLGPGNVADLPRIYAEAAVLALPAIWEAFGMVLVEALAAGTPVVGCDHGGIPDVVSDRRIGRLFAPGRLRGESDNVAGLVVALGEALDLARDPETSARCRAHAAGFGWAALGPRYAALHE
ncbi:MAG: glycosyltransferase family 4 protein [Alphaproteobacteria bacterium]|nr:glycosyltransferase family 4 protein [Alphaproteobacteria bacterium]